MRPRVLGVGLLAGIFALVADGDVANAITMTTAPEIEPFTLTTAPVTFEVSNDGTPPATVTTNSPQIASQALTFNQFDAGLGTLTGVTITFSTVYGATVTVTLSEFGDAGSIEFFADAEVDHSLANVALITTQSSLQQLSASCTPPLGELCNASESENNVSFNTPPGGVGLAASLASFIGPGTYDLTATLNSALTPRISPDNGTSFADNSTFSGTLTATWNGTVSVVYTFETDATAVPVPLSLWLLVAGLGGVALWRRHLR